MRLRVSPIFADITFLSNQKKVCCWVKWSFQKYLKWLLCAGLHALGGDNGESVMIPAFIEVAVKDKQSKQFTIIYV
jgi:hypothetical protein